MLYLALGILGATVMPHNLYLHSGIVQTRAYGETLPEKREALKFATIDSTVALMFALLVNASILILAAATFHKAGMSDIAELGEAHSLLAPLLGLAIAPTLFGIALLCCGINSTVTATLAGQIVMEGFLNIRLPPWLRRLITRAIAIVPAAIVTIWYGESGTAHLLVLTQVVLSLQLSFAVFPLVMFTADRAKMGALVAPRWLTALRRRDRRRHRRPQHQAAVGLRVRMKLASFSPPELVEGTGRRSRPLDGLGARMSGGAELGKLSPSQRRQCPPILNPRY